MSDKDTIYRQDAVKTMYDLCENIDQEFLHIDVIVDALENLPSAEPRKKGKWEYFSENIDGLSFGIKRCSICGASKPMKLFHWEDTEINFCPNCGADMRQGEDDNV